MKIMARESYNNEIMARESYYNEDYGTMELQ